MFLKFQALVRATGFRAFLFLTENAFRPTDRRANSKFKSRTTFYSIKLTLCARLVRIFQREPAHSLIENIRLMQLE